MTISSSDLAKRRRTRTRAKLRKVSNMRPRLSVFRSSKHIYAQLIDDIEGRTITQASTKDKEFKGEKGSNVEAASEIGKLVAERAKKAGVSKVIFDRGSYMYHGRIKALAEAAREAGLNFYRIFDMAQATIKRRRESREESDLIERLVSINRVAKVVKGGRRFGFAAIVVVGDGNGRVGHGSGKAREVPEAIRKATDQAKTTMVRVPLREGRTLHHDMRGRYGAGRVILRAAPAGTGVIAGGPLRAIFECLGVQDVVSKSVGSSNPHNMIKAAFDALAKTASPRLVASRRGIKVSQITGQRGSTEDSTSQESARG